MFIGHFAPAFVAAAAYSRGPKLGTYFIAAQLTDWALFGLAIGGVEEMSMDHGAAMMPVTLDYGPFTHSLAGTTAWALAFAVVIAIWHRNTLAGLLGGTVVMSHWILDWLTHRSDLTLAGGDQMLGLGLWDHPEIAMPLEIGITLAAILFYMRRSRGPAAQPAILIATLLAFQMINWFGPQPEEAGIFFAAQGMLAFAILTGLAFWVGENRYFSQRGGLAAASL